ncbi:MAG: N-carbamoylputrescine amidase [Pseudomonadota bacterium]
MRTVTLAATQMACSWDRDANIAKAEALVRAAADNGAQVILLQELFETPYFCLEQNREHLGLSTTLEDNRAVSHFQSIARELGVVLPISYFEKAGLTGYNALAIVDADGSILTNYRKTHLPQYPGYEEKYYFSHGDTGFHVVETRYGRLGCGVCWDQWFPETARCLALKGAEILMFPTAIGTEKDNPAIDSAAHWRRVMQGHAAANIIPLVASNRVGAETDGATSSTFYGTSFIADHTGAIVAEADRSAETHITATIDLDLTNEYRRTWGVFRDRRPEMYSALRTMDGTTPVASG